MILSWDLLDNLDHLDNDEPHDDVDLCDFVDVDLAGDEGGLGKGFGFGSVGGFGDVGVDQTGDCGDGRGVSKIMSPFSIHIFQLVAGIFVMDMISSYVSIPPTSSHFQIIAWAIACPHPMYCPQFPVFTLTGMLTVLNVNMQYVILNVMLNVSIMVNLNDASTN